jgi:ribonuclease HI
MTPENPHYLLFSEASQDRSAAQTWRFVLQNVESQRRFSATDSEPSETGHERLELLAVVRGLEALDRPARVTLVTKSRYVSRGFRRGLEEWRNNGWRWECFGRMVPVKNADLWQRIDRALNYHRLECRTWRFDMPTASERVESAPGVEQRVEQPAGKLRHRHPDRRPASRPAETVGRWIEGVVRPLRSRASLCGTA